MNNTDYYNKRKLTNKQIKRKRIIRKMRKVLLLSYLGLLILLEFAGVAALLLGIGGMDGYTAFPDAKLFPCIAFMIGGALAIALANFGEKLVKVN